MKDEDELAINSVSLDRRRAVISTAVFLICVILFIVQPFDWDVGLIAVSGALVLIMTKCIDGKKALKNMQWSAVITLGAALAVAQGFVKSGAGGSRLRFRCKPCHGNTGRVHFDHHGRGGRISF